MFLGLAFLTENFSLTLILAVALVDGVLSIVGRALTRASVAVMLEPVGLLREGNALFNLVFAGSTAAGPALAGLLIAWQGVAAALVLDAARSPSSLFYWPSRKASALNAPTQAHGPRASRRGSRGSATGHMCGDFCLVRPRRLSSLPVSYRSRSSTPRRRSTPATPASARS